MGDRMMLVSEVREQWTPGDAWTWAEEERYLHSAPCLCQNDPKTVSADAEPVCTTPGHYQKALEDHIASVGAITQPICLGTDGRVWDGHHRVVAAHRLGIELIPVEGDHA